MQTAHGTSSSVSCSAGNTRRSALRSGSHSVTFNSDYNIISPTVIERCNGLVESCRRKVSDLNEGTMPIHMTDVVSRLSR